MFYDLKVTYGNLEFYYHEDFVKAKYSPKVMKVSTRLRTVPTYALDWATIVAHIPWISQSFIFDFMPMILYTTTIYLKVLKAYLLGKH